MTLKNGFSLGGYLPALFGETNSLSTSYLDQSPRDDQEAMEWALTAAMATAGHSSPNPNVGCIVVRDHKVVAQGVTQQFGGLHGERAAILKSPHPDALRGATAYIMLEPCAHYGKQPPCTEALINAGIKTCVIGSQDPHPLVQGRGLKRLDQAGITIQKSTLAQECIAFNLPFFFQCTYHRPLIVAKWAQTLNGFLADDGHGSQWISGPKARRVTHYLRTKYDAILVGAGTVLADGPSLTARLGDQQTSRQPLKIIFDPSARLSRCQDTSIIAKILAKTLNNTSKSVLITNKAVPIPPWLMGLDPHLYCIKVPDKNTAFPLILDHFNSSEFLQWYGLPIQSIFVEGGPALINYLINTNFIDAFHIFINPSFVGGNHHQINPLGHTHNTQVATMERYHLLQSTILDQDTLIEMIPKDRYQAIFAKLQADF